MRKWIWFVLQEAAGRRKTDLWAVVTKTSHLGLVKWYGGWRRYCFFPNVGTLFEQDCLRDIADFCERETLAHRSAR